MATWYNCTMCGAPTLDTNLGATGPEGDVATIDATRLAVSDVDNAAGELTYTVSTAPTNGWSKWTGRNGKG